MLWFGKTRLNQNWVKAMNDDGDSKTAEHSHNAHTVHEYQSIVDLWVTYQTLVNMIKEMHR